MKLIQGVLTLADGEKIEAGPDTTIEVKPSGVVQVDTRVGIRAGYGGGTITTLYAQGEWRRMVKPALPKGFSTTLPTPQ